MSEAQHAPEGQVIEGRYRVVSRIADGGMATVYQAVDERLGRTVAIKIMHTQLAQGPQRDQFVERFHREARSAAAIANPHIVQVYDTGEFDGLDFLVMEYVHGVNLRYEMNQQVTFSVRETLRIVGETLDGLASAHRAGVVHRDIKPENILLNDRGHVQITDFGLAKAVSQATLSSTGMLLGTAAYLAPEMIEHNQATAQGDLYSVGIMAWEMLAGEPPFQSDNPVTMVFKHVHEDVPPVITRCPGIEPSVSEFIAQLTARSVEDRPADAMEAQRLLRTVISGMPMEAWLYRRSDDPMRDESTGDGESPLAPNGLVASRREGGHDAAASTTAVAQSDYPPQPPAPSSPSSSATMSATASADMSPDASATTPSDGRSGAANTPDTRTRILATDSNAARKPRSITSQDAFTQAITTTDTSDIEPSGVPEHSRGGRRRSKVPIIVAAIMAVVLAAGAGCGAWWYYSQSWWYELFT